MGRRSRANSFIASTWLTLLGLLLWLSLASPLSAAPATSRETSPPELVVYVREGCPHCASAKRFLDSLQVEAPNLRVEMRPVEPPEHAEELLERSRAAGIWPWAPALKCSARWRPW